jgi:hypothetical protein
MENMAETPRDGLNNTATERQRTRQDAQTIRTPGKADPQEDEGPHVSHQCNITDCTEHRPHEMGQWGADTDAGEWPRRLGEARRAQGPPYPTAPHQNLARHSLTI